MGRWNRTGKKVVPLKAGQNGSSQTAAPKPAGRSGSRKRRFAVIAVWIFVLVMLSGIVGYFIYEQQIKPGKHYRGYQITSRIERGDTADTHYLQYGSRILRYNRDGISVLDGEGTIFWTAAYNMQNPTVSMAGNYVAVAEVGGRQLFVYNEKGTASEMEILSDILQISVSEQGEVAVLMQEEGRNEIQIIDPYAAGDKKKVEILTYVEEDGYAMAIALSKDGAKLVTSYFLAEGNRLTSNLTFYNFTGVGQGVNANRIVGIYPYEDVIFAELAFLDNNTVCAYGDNRLSVFSMRQKPELRWEQEYSQRLRWTANNEDYIAVVIETEDVSTAGLLQVYEKGGSKTVERKLSFVCRGLGLHKEDFWVYSELECLILRPGNKVKYEGEFQEGVQYLFAGKEPDQFFQVNGQYIEEMRLKDTAE